METFSLASYCLAFFGTTFLLWILRPIAFRSGWIDQPGDRKAHTGEVPLVGGPAMAGGLLLSLAVWDSDPVFWTAALALVLVGSVDDFFGISARKKLLAQFVVAITMVTWGGMVLTKGGELAGEVVPTRFRTR